MGAYANIDTPFAGMLSGTGPKRVLSKRCADSAGIAFGMPVFGYVGDSGIGTARDDNVHTYKKDRCILTWSTEFTGGEVITITVNGTAVTDVTYATSHANTMSLIAAQIEAEIEGCSVTVADTLIHHIDIDGTEMTVSEAVTGGATPTGTPTYETRMIFIGFAIFTQVEAPLRSELDGTVIDAASAKYDYKESMGVVTLGDLYVVTSEAVNARAACYAIVASGDTQGQTCMTTGSNQVLSGATFEQTVDASGVALVRIVK